MKIPINKTLVIIAVIIFLGATGTYAYISSSQSQTIEEEEKTTKVSKGNISVSIRFDGKSVIDRRDLSFEISGIVRGVTVKEGDVVKPWQTVAYLDTREAQKNLQSSMRDYLAERNDFEEAKQVTYPDSLPVNDTIKRILEKNQWNLETSVADYELKQLAVQKSYLTSPIAGTVASVDIKPGEFGTTTKTAITIVDAQSLVFESYVEDIDALKVKIGQQARMTFDALPEDTFDGVVSFVSPVATIDENDLSTYKVLITFGQPLNATLLDGMTGEVEVISKEVQDVVKIPNTTVKRDEGKSIVYVKTESGNEKKEVQLGFTNGKEVEVISGLEAGEMVVNWN